MNCHKRIFTLIILITVIACGGMAGVSFAAENRGRGAPADALPKDLKNVSVKDYFLPGKAKEAGAIQTAMGHVVVARGDLSQAYFAINGDKLYEQDIVFTLKASRCRIKLLNNDVITLGAHTRITVKEVSGDRNAPEKKTNLSMARGQAMFYAIRLLNQKGTTMTVESPTSVAGVRGTKFGMEVTIESEKTIGALPLLLADASDDWGRHLILAQANPPTPNITTTVHGFDGTVTVTSTVDGRTQSVGAGQTVSASPQGIGAIMPTPPQVSQRFQSATNVPPPAGGASGSQSSGSSSGTTSSNTADAKTTSDGTGTSTTNTTVDTSNITQAQNVNTEEQAAPTPTPTPTPTPAATDPVTDPRTNASGGSSNYGYFVSLLSNVTDGTLAGAFASQNRYNGDSNIWARGPNDANDTNDPDYTRVLGQEGIKGATLKWVVFKSGTKNSGELNSTISDHEIGKTDNMNWGYGTIADSFTVDSKTYAFDNRAYYIFGNSIPSMASLSGSATYSGDAYGAYWTAAGGKNMTGTFKTDVNLTSAQLSNFNLDVSGNGASAYIHNASGSIGSDAAFSTTGGTWNLNGVTPDNTTAKGSLYGSGGVNMGGVWGMYSSTNNTAAGGIFQGDKTVVTPTDPVTDPKTNASGSKVGYFATILSNLTGGTIMEGFGSGYRYDTNSNIWAAGHKSSADYTRVLGSGGGGFGTPTLKWVVFDSGTKDSGLLNSAISSTTIGQNSYMEWGYATVPDSFTVDNTSYAFDNRTYWISGSNTPSLVTASVVATYSGPAYGTYWTAAGGINMTGNFSSDVDFTSAKVTNFKLDVSGTGASASINGAYGYIASDASLQIGQNTGTWNLNGITPDKTYVNGSLYGPSSDSMGGAWGMGNSTDNTGAVGIFQGNKSVIQMGQMGHFAGMVEMVEDSGYNYMDTYLTTQLQNFSSNNAFAMGGVGSAQIDGTGATKNMVGLGTVFGLWTGSQPVTFSQVGSNEYMEWGTWTQATAMSTSNMYSSYDFMNQGAYVWGSATTDSEMATLKSNMITANYSGPAWGTYFAGGGAGTKLDGTFSGTVEFAGQAVTDFNINVSGGGNTVNINNATGNFIGGTSTFTITPNPDPVKWQINGVDATTKGASGTVYGNKADAGKYVGGVWKAGFSSMAQAVGGFQGKK